MNNNNLTLNVTGGNSSKTVWNAYKYSKPVTDYSTSTTNSFSSTKSYSDGSGYSGTLSASGNTLLSDSTTVPGATKTAIGSRSSTSNNLPSSIFYNDDQGYSGTLYGQGVTISTVQTGGSYTPADSKTVTQNGGTIATVNKQYWDGSKWTYISYSVSGDKSSSKYYNDGAYSGTLYHNGGVQTYDNNYALPSNPTPGLYVFNTNGGYWIYSGTVTKPAVDTRTYSTVYSQNYSGTVYKSSITVNTYKQNYSGTAYKGAYDNYYSYNATITYDTDTTAPTLSFSKNPSTWINGDVKITAVGSDTESGVSRIQTPDGNWVIGTTAGYTVFENGVYQFAVVDKLGNQSIQSISIDSIDKIAPTLKLTQSITNWANKNIISVSASDNADGSGIKSITLPDGQVIDASTTTYNILKNGTYKFTTIDNVGNKTVESITLNNIDTTAPSIDLKVTNNLVTNKLVTIEANAHDSESGIESIILPNSEMVNSSSTTYNVNSNGIYTFTALDKAGNKVSSCITVNNIVAIDTTSGLDHFEYKLDGATIQDWITYNGKLNITNEGITNIFARAVDKSGNISDIAKSLVKIDRSKPINSNVQIIVK